MNYYSHHIGDYTTDTAHLSLLEDGAYRRLMDRYYTTEAPLPADDTLFRVIRARSPDEQEAVRVVLAEFFDLTDAGWTHKRCDAEIDAFKAKSGKAADAANKRWSKPSNANAMPTHSERNADAMPTNNQEPITTNQEPEEKAEAAPKKRKAVATATRLPADWLPTDGDASYCKTKRPDLLLHEVAERFRDYWLGCGGKKVDWNATWRNWVQNERRGSAQGPPAYQTANDKAKSLADRLTGKTRNEPSFEFIDLNTVPP